MSDICLVAGPSGLVVSARVVISPSSQECGCFQSSALYPGNLGPPIKSGVFGLPYAAPYVVTMFSVITSHEADTEAGCSRDQTRGSKPVFTPYMAIAERNGG